MNNFTKRLLFGTLYISLIIVATKFNRILYYIIFSVFMFFCIYEFKQMQKIKSNIPFLTAASFVFLLYELNNFLNPLIPLKYTFSIIIALLFIPFITSLFNKENDTKPEKIFLLFFYIILPFLFIFSIPFVQNGKFNPHIVLGVFILIWVNDTFAFLIGSKIGKHKLFKRISPNKTVEGFIGGFIFTIISSLIISKYYTDLTTFNWIVIAIISSVFGSLGDLIESMFKRQANVKDSSNLIPGHGGFLDRLDSIIFASPFVFIYLILIN